MVDRVSPLNGAAPARPGAGEREKPAAPRTLWIKLEDSGQTFDWLKKLLDMFPGSDSAIVYLADTGKKLKLQTGCLIHDALLAELRETLGEASVALR